MAPDKIKVDRNVGDLGEIEFERWCALCGLLSTRPAKDRMGWDYFIEFEPEVKIDAPLDNKFEIRKALVQIKSTDTSGKAVRGKLSAFKLLVDTDLPTFIVHIDYAGKNIVRQAWLLHIGPSQIETILERIRKAEKEGRFDINNINMGLPLADAVRIKPDGSNLREAIISSISLSSDDYVSAKSRFRSPCEYNEDSVKAHFTLAPDQHIDALVDLMIGKLPSIKIDDMVVDKTRFGISLDQDIDRISKGILSVDVKPFQQATVIVENAQGNQRVEMIADVYAPNIPKLPKRYRKLRIASKFLELVCNFGKKKIEFKYDIDDNIKLPLNMLANALRFGACMTKGGSTIEVDLGPERGGFAPTSVGDNFPPRWQAISEFASLIAVAIFRHRPTASYDMTFNELEEIFNENKNMFALITRPGLEMKFAIEQEGPPSLPERGVIFCPACIEFLHLAYTAILRIEVSSLQIDSDGDVCIKGSYPTVVEDSIVDFKNIDLLKLNKIADSLGRDANSENIMAIATSLIDPKTFI